MPEETQIDQRLGHDAGRECRRPPGARRRRPPARPLLPARSCPSGRHSSDRGAGPRWLVPAAETQRRRASAWSACLVSRQEDQCEDETGRAQGTLIQNMNRQFRWVRITPPTSGPRMGPAVNGSIAMLTVRPSALPAAACIMSVPMAGINKPPPNPWTTRQTIREAAFQARADPTDATRNKAEGEDPRPSAAEALQGPGAQRDSHAESKHVTGRHPLDGRHTHLQLSRRGSGGRR